MARGKKRKINNFNCHQCLNPLSDYVFSLKSLDTFLKFYEEIWLSIDMMETKEVNQQQNHPVLLKFVIISITSSPPEHKGI